ncbi:hypothetical protein D8674_034919 [Pyrus ussuriensis x Pyrus communis]|uniref:Retrotransposon gag domain-containing protein n=1 Tax=Pyrus ussuriensis x Pyrus communis TaxID=2448454 RepID=A0A5N5GBL9_9ROSA|nr:hypothetical protein D8674_034919 [Pyrus ussuriensis x Pyrus communis]
MAPRSKRNTTRSDNALDAGEAATQLDKSQHKYDMLDIIVAIHALVQNSISKPNEKASNKDCTPKENVSHEESTAIVGKGLEKTPSFVTRENVIAMLKKEMHKSSEDWKDVPETPYLTSALHMPYPKGCETLNLVLFYGRKVTTTQPNNIRQQQGEDPVTFIKRFRDLALDCYEEKDDEALVEICINNIVADHRVSLENISISQFSRFLAAVRNTSLSIKPSTLEN